MTSHKSKSKDFKNDINIVFESLNKWFEASELSLNFDNVDFYTNIILVSSENRIGLDFLLMVFDRSFM
jgi:hypothetical protein